MKCIISDENQLVEKIKLINPKIVGIDGIDGVGKSTIIAPLISKIIKARIINIDKYLNEKQGKYFQEINFKKIKQDINQCLGTDNLIIEGVLLLKILKKIDLKVDCLIYVSDNVWVYDWCEYGPYYQRKLEEITKDVEKKTDKVSKALRTYTKPYKLDGFRKEIYHYTYEYMPFNSANIIFIKQ